MNLKKFFQEEAGTAEATSFVIMIAAAGLLLALGLIIWYGDLSNIFQTDGQRVDTLRSAIPSGS